MGKAALVAWKNDVFCRRFLTKNAAKFEEIGEEKFLEDQLRDRTIPVKADSGIDEPPGDEAEVVEVIENKGIAIDSKA